MKVIKRLAIGSVITVGLLYVLICGLLYFFQEKFIFLPKKIDKNYTFTFSDDFEERFFQVPSGEVIHGVHFLSEDTKGLIFYLHGNAGNVDGWGNVASPFLQMGYDVFVLDYRGYGKSEGTISSEDELFSDHQFIYDQFLKEYDEHEVIVLGYSIGTGMAAKLAADNNPKHLILQAPYYSLTDMMELQFPFVPTFLLKYKFATNEYLEECQMPVTLFHGTDDGIIPMDSSQRLHELHPESSLILLDGQGHNGMTDNWEYLHRMSEILEKSFEDNEE